MMGNIVLPEYVNIIQRGLAIHMEIFSILIRLFFISCP